MTVSRSQKWSASRRCPQCGGWEGDPRGKDKRCLGFLMQGGEALVCTRVESPIRTKDGGPVDGWVHRLVERRREEPEAIYSYRDEEGRELFQVVRFPGKKIRQRRHDPGSPDSKADGFVWSLGDVRRVLYRLPELIAATGHVYLVEGEKDVDTLLVRGHTATCNPHGAGPGKWERTQDLARKVLAGRDVTVIADNDAEGIPHAQRSAASLEGFVKSVRLVTCAKGKDVTDHIHAGGTLGELVELTTESDEDAPPLEPPPGMFDDEPAPKQDLHVAPEAEAHIVAAMMLSRECLAATELIGPADFSDQRLATIFGGCLEARESGRAADPVTVATFLRSHGHLDAVGGLDKLTMMANAVAVQEPRADEIRGLSEILRTRALERKAVALVQEGAAAIASANGTTLSVAASLSMALTRLAEARVDRPKFEYITAADMLTEDAPLTYLVEHLGLVDGGGPPHMIAGAGYSGKTMICQDMALSLASGRHVWGLRAGQALLPRPPRGSRARRQAHQASLPTPRACEGDRSSRTRGRAQGRRLPEGTSSSRGSVVTLAGSYGRSRRHASRLATRRRRGSRRKLIRVS